MVSLGKGVLSVTAVVGGIKARAGASCGLVVMGGVINHCLCSLDSKSPGSRISVGEGLDGFQGMKIPSL